MKATLLALLVSTLIIGLANLAVSLGLISPGGGANKYRAVPAREMDEIGFQKLAAENGIEVSEDGTITFPKEMRDQLAKFRMLPYTIAEIEKEGWDFVSVTSDNYYLFRKK